MPKNPLSRPPKSMSKRQPSPPEQASPINRVLEQAVLALQMQRMDEAERLAAQVLKSNRGNIVAAGLLGRVLLAKNRPLEAIDVLQRSARRSDDPELETLLAVALGAAGRETSALGAAALPIFDEINPQFDVLLKPQRG